MTERFVQYLIAGSLYAVSLKYFFEVNWGCAFYFLLTAAFFAIWIELHKNKDREQTVYKDCSWFVNPPAPPDIGKGNQNDSNGGRNS